MLLSLFALNFKLKTYSLVLVKIMVDTLSVKLTMLWLHSSCCVCFDLVGTDATVSFIVLF